MKITIVAAIGPGRELGSKGDLVYSLRDDMRHFKEYTMGHPVVMGRVTFESFPGGPLKGRTNIVITRNADATFPEGVLKASSLAEAVALASACEGGDEVMIIGGGSVYRAAMELATDMELTEVAAEPTVEADTFFPEVDGDEWTATDDSGLLTDSRSGAPYRIVHYVRK